MCGLTRMCISVVYMCLCAIGQNTERHKILHTDVQVHATHTKL